MTALSIGPNLDIGGVDELLSLLKKPARTKGDVRLSIDNVDKLHCATMQVLCAFVKDRAQAKGRTVIDAPAELRSAAALLGVAATLGLDTPAGVAT